MVQNVEIKTKDYRVFEVKLDGKNIECDICNLDIHMEAGCLPILTLKVPCMNLTIENTDMEVNAPSDAVSNDEITHVGYTAEQCGYEK